MFCHCRCQCAETPLVLRVKWTMGSQQLAGHRINPLPARSQRRNHSTHYFPVSVLANCANAPAVDTGILASNMAYDTKCLSLAGSCVRLIEAAHEVLQGYVAS